MQKSIDTDKQCIERIILHITEIKECLIDSDINTPSELEDSKYAKYAITQLITNVHELSKNLQSDTFQKLESLSKIKLALARNIASHDYTKVNFKIIHRVCLQLTNEAVITELKALLEEIKDGIYQ